jgi:STE24 endopeptidase
MIGVVIVIGFAFVSWGINFALLRWGQKWGVRGINDGAVLPLAVIVFSLYFLLMTPVTNSITRMMEFEADMYGLNAARQPDTCKDSCRTQCSTASEHLEATATRKGGK